MLAKYKTVVAASACVAAVWAAPAQAQIRLPHLVGSGMVLQREQPVTIWGWASAGEKVTVAFQGKTYQATATPAGKWRVALPALKAGGPYTMTLKASNQVQLNDILVGDVWLCSGQSNMEMPMSSVKDKYPEEMASANNPRIRQFLVPMRYAFQGPQENVTGGRWMAATPQSIGQFSAVGYFFAKDLYAKYQVPIGLIKNAVGGSPAEAWLSAAALKQFPVYEQKSEKYRDSAYLAEVQVRERETSRAWQQRLHQADQGEAPNQTKWSSLQYSATDWPTMNVPGYWSYQGLGPINGVVWFRKEVHVPASMVGHPAQLELGTIVDSDSTYVNGQLVGSAGSQYDLRKYTIASGVLVPGRNTIVVRVINNSGRGGFTPEKLYQLRAGGQSLDLNGPWHYKLGASTTPAPSTTYFQFLPGGLYNGMIAPLLPYAIKGVLWYQGESNAGHPQDYQALMTSLINDWRQHYQQPNLPFLYVQLPDFMATRKEPSESGWAELRESQRRLLAMPYTGMAVTLGLGEWNDIHPLAKQPVGQRLALAAEKVAYGDRQVVYSGPLYQAMQVAGNKVTLKFSNVGSGLVTKDGEPRHFAVAGADHKYVWAKAKLEGNQVVVWSDQVPNPVSVRYAWADNPEGANLYNREGLPASPFQASIQPQ
ncbi:sialate O-acetylesterase [Hymenobacter sp. YC55]|uniref:sialate O-acetylesterase n=1 Tax=Hymenobacter sp. YC55 TaxID=3034019 RepID=UPI0023F91DE8|nr:sialate O-acetylesterase [Hymenobacter sp. YC55]MDF7814920.1 sialate O-acetylesterase [Hymenobacter sp. YC55]